MIGDPSREGCADRPVGGVLYTIVRATQFHQFAEMLLSALSKPG